MSQLSREVCIVTADLAAADPAVLELAVAGADAVLSSLGPRSAHEMGIATRTYAEPFAQQRVDLILGAVQAPHPELMVYGRPGRELAWSMRHWQLLLKR